MWCVCGGLWFLLVCRLAGVLGLWGNSLVMCGGVGLGLVGVGVVCVWCWGGGVVVGLKMGRDREWIGVGRMI